jgi:hypothetical protein
MLPVIVLLVVSPFIAFFDFRTARIPERITLPWLGLSMGFAIAAWPNSYAGVINAFIIALGLGAMIVSGISQGDHYLGFADLIVATAVALTFAALGPRSLLTPVEVFVVASLATLFLAIGRRRWTPTASGPLGGCLASAACAAAVFQFFHPA